MKSRKNTNNTFSEEVENNGWLGKRHPLQTIVSSDLLDFPEMTEDDLKIMFAGYQYKNTIAYLAEMIDEPENITIQYGKDETNFLKAQVQSRHIGAKQYKCFVDYNCNFNGYKGITRYCYECPNGRRSVRFCSHIAGPIKILDIRKK